MILFSLLTIAAGFYFLVHCTLRVGISRLQYPLSKEKPFVSVIIAARNEEKHLPQLLECLLAQTYPHYEIIIADDRSSDATPAILARVSGENPRLRVITIKETLPDMPPKKNALQQAIRVARGEILCFTDADCLPPQEWLATLVACFEPSVGVVAGYSPYLSQRTVSRDGLLSFFIAYEEFRAAVWSAGSIGIGKGWLCTGRNFAYRKTVFEEVGGFEKIKRSISGDDDLFLLLVRRTTSWQIRYVSAPENHVPTFPPSTFREFVEQRKRHFSAAKFFPLSMKLFFALYHGSNLFLLSAMIFSLFRMEYLFVAITAMGVKFAADYLLLSKGSSLLQERKFLWFILPMELLYIAYNSFIGPLGLLLKFSWKPVPRQ